MRYEISKTVRLAAADVDWLSEVSARTLLTESQILRFGLVLAREQFDAAGSGAGVTAEGEEDGELH